MLKKKTCNAQSKTLFKIKSTKRPISATNFSKATRQPRNYSKS